MKMGLLFNNNLSKNIQGSLGGFSITYSKGGVSRSDQHYNKFLQRYNLDGLFTFLKIHYVLQIHNQCSFPLFK